jgi:putative DNA primase/helicase
MMDFTAFLRDLGLQPGAIVPDGKVRRCRTDDKPRHRNGAYWLAPEGNFGWAQNWAIHQAPVLWRASGDVVVPEFDPAAHRRRNQEARAARQRAIDAARKFYASCSPLLGGHEYLHAKDLDMTGCRGLKVDRDGWLVIPMTRRGEIMSVQRIAPDGTKRFWPGAPTSGASYWIERQRATLTVLAEGLATGLAIFAAVPFARVVVAFNAGNLPRIAGEMPRRGLVCVAADNDHATEQRIGENPGIVYATEAADLLGCGVAVPEKISGTDWLDLRIQRTLERVDRGVREGIARREADGEITRAMMRAAKMARAA